MFIKNMPMCFIPLELQVIFPALNIRVKNVAGIYSLEHKGESNLFSQLFALLQLDKRLRQHTSKEEEHVAPLNFSMDFVLGMTPFVFMPAFLHIHTPVDIAKV